MMAKPLNDQQLAGQRLMVGFDGTTFNSDLQFLIEKLHVGGVILFTRNILEPRQLQNLCTDIQRCNHRSGLPPLSIAIDQEGGDVARLKKPFAQHPGAAQMKSEEDACEFVRITAAELRSAGVNMNMAPVMDVAPGEIPSIMASRSYGSDPAQVSRMGCRVIEHFQQRNIMAVAKHFPGIGRTVLDSHEDMPTLDVDMDTLKKSDLVPFKDAIDCQVAGMMLSHIFYKRIDPDWPASLSPVIAGDLLRKGLGYKGVVMTDDLDMGAIKKHYDIETVITQILSADVDMALICHKGPDIQAAHEIILRQITDSAEHRHKGIESVNRILQLKMKYLGYQ
jgi:beta-N-acetylhexosaminidase